MKELRMKVSLDESGFLASAGRVESAVARLSRGGLASGFIQSFKKIGDKGAFAGMLDGIENAARATGKFKASFTAALDAKSKHVTDLVLVKKAADQLGQSLIPRTSSRN